MPIGKVDITEAIRAYYLDDPRRQGKLPNNDEYKPYGEGPALNAWLKLTSTDPRFVLNTKEARVFQDIGGVPVIRKDADAYGIHPSYYQQQDVAGAARQAVAAPNAARQAPAGPPAAGYPSNYGVWNNPAPASSSGRPGL